MKYWPTLLLPGGLFLFSLFCLLFLQIFVIKFLQNTDTIFKNYPMKYLLILPLFFLITIKTKAQEINRFFYEVQYKPKKDSLRNETAMMVLDIKKDQSIFKDYQLIVSDSISNEVFKKMQKTGIYENQTALPNVRFTYSVTKKHPDMEVQYTEDIMNGLTPITFGYQEKLNFDWKIQKETQKIGEYNAQKATLNFAGRKWTAWFCKDLPFNDGPYKFNGLPGLIVKIEDDQQHYSFTLKGNRKAKDSSEDSLVKKFTSGNVKIVEKGRFTKTFENYKQDPLAAMRSELTPQLLGMTMPGTDMKVKDFIEKQGKEIKESYKLNNNPIERE
ncbi:GLPGLI family protein [Chryseobacterium sp. PvR013]|uniref:GLPGLI family protein n=1 Tax=Chryseobacterium sp. PvR013 TaxID=2806595 RepID=UPI001B56FF16|nr:GLPGLI family protein [Chryseobacterium sp. PvR013]MBP1165785.1 GLPGLI family protein [Chryseobacterium sp. PvR013]